MPRFAGKALLTLLTVSRSTKSRRPDWDRIVILASIAVTVGLIALYAYGKATSRW